jgi:hypothetical protein
MAHPKIISISKRDLNKMLHRMDETIGRQATPHQFNTKMNFENCSKDLDVQ